MKKIQVLPISQHEPTHLGRIAKERSTERRSVIHAINDMMSRTPHAIAVTDGDQEWTYETLRRKANVVANTLANYEITRGSVVGMHLPRCADAIATMLGIMMSGCVYLPLDPSYPSGRLRFMLDRAEAVAVISEGSDPDTYGHNRIWLPPPSQLPMSPEALESDVPICSSTNVQHFRLEDCAYILFTSGSTGEPKGVMVTHENITSLIEWSVKVFGVTEFDASATSSSLTFDPSLAEILLPLSVGGTVHMIPHALALGQLNREVSFIATTPTVANELLRAGLLPPLKVLMVGGEVLASDMAARLLDSGRVGRLLNAYGPTECTICVTVEEVTPPVSEIVPIGRQVPGSEVLILDQNGQRLPDGEVGEICIFGGQVANGYINDPSGTTERFVVGPGPTADLERYYRTGDLGYRLEDGLIYFAGRADRQVKINGIRIELEEVDAILRSHPQVSEATTILDDNYRMVAYVVPAHPSVNIDIADLKKHLSESLPRFMVPAGIRVLSEFPKTVSGKLDDEALPEWSPHRTEDRSSATDGRDELTARVVKIVADVTGFVGHIRSSDDFINDLGGTSLGIIRVLVEFERYSGRRVRMSDALLDTSIGGLVNLLRGETVAAPADFAFNTDGDAPPIFLIHAYLGGMLGFRRLAELLPLNQPVYGLHVHRTSEQVGDELTISQLAQDALNRIHTIQPTGRITMLGHSAGGLIVFEAARKILEAGSAEPRVLLMDSPVVCNSLEYYWSELVLTWQDKAIRAIRAPRRIIGRLLREARPRHSRVCQTAQNDDLMELAGKYLEPTSSAVRRYRASKYGGNITVMRTHQGQVMALGRRRLGWLSVTKGTLSVIDVPGAHVSMLQKPHIEYLAKKVVGWLTGE